MKTYRVAIGIKILVIFTAIFTLIFGTYFILNDTNASVWQRVIVIMTILLGLFGILPIFKLRVIVEDKKIEVFTLEILVILLGKTKGITYQSLNWNEIEELSSIYVLYPETPIITLKPKPYLNKKPIQFMGMPIELIRDIISHLPPETKVNLYPYLKRKLEGKQTWFYVK